MHRPRTTLVAIAALVAAVLAGSPPADAKPGPVTATWKLAPGGYDVVAGMDAVWAADIDEVHDGQLYRLDPTTHALRLLTTLPFPLGGVALGFGSVWVSDVAGNAVWRLTPTGRVQVEIAVGLQPGWLHAAFGSMWVGNHHSASLSRIDPTSNAVIATTPAGDQNAFRNGPQDITDDGTRLYVGSSNLQALQTVDPATNTTSTPPSISDAFCDQLRAIAGFVWSADGCTGAIYQLNPDGTVQQAFYPDRGYSQTLTTVRGEVWIGTNQSVDPDSGQGSDAVLQERNPVTGTLLRTIQIGGNVRNLAAGYGALWVYDATSNSLKRVDL
jgi:streptogramin lyase